jgi:energy-coupling factor transport system permease protein
MRASFQYLGRGSWLAKRDPRVVLIAAGAFVIGAVQLRDARHLLAALVVALVFYRLAAIPFRRVRVQWIYLSLTIVMIAGLNTIITGGRAGGFAESELHVLFRVPLLGAPVTAEAISLSVSQALRFLGAVAVSLPIAYSIAPGDFAVALRRLGLPDRGAITIDLAIRFLPTLVQEFAETIDAQRVRGYDPLSGKGGPISRIRRIAPIFVPVTVGAVAGAEDTIDAMDLRGFGVGKRTWSRTLRFAPADWLVIGVFVAFVVVATFLNFTGRSQHYLVPFLVGT